MVELRRDDLQLFLIHYSFFVSVLYCYIYNKANIEFKIDSKKDSKINSKNDSKIDSKNDSKLHSKNDSKLHSKKRPQTPLQVLQHAQILYLFQFAGEMSNSYMYKFPQNNIYSYTIIAHSLRKIHISGNREKKLFKD